MNQHFAPSDLLPTLQMFGLDVVDTTLDQVVGRLLDEVKAKRFRRVNFANANNVNIAHRDGAFRSALTNSTVLPDGIGMDLACRLLNGRRFTADLNGTDLVPKLLEAAPRGTTIGLIGAAPGIADRAASSINELAPQVDVQHVAHGFLSDDERRKFVADLAQSPVDILLVAMGTPMQEKWAAQNITASHTTLVLTVGALFDFLSGNVDRAPNWVRKSRFEWAYRLSREPGRLWQRYLIGNGIFLARALALKLSGRS
ncbi:MAG: WecB/TagA/CpsF family glycosyltransferase [Pseudomonadota bacterium]